MRCSAEASRLVYLSQLFWHALNHSTGSMRVLIGAHVWLSQTSLPAQRMCGLCGAGQAAGVFDCQLCCVEASSSVGLGPRCKRTCGVGGRSENRNKTGFLEACLLAPELATVNFNLSCRTKAHAMHGAEL